MSEPIQAGRHEAGRYSASVFAPYPAELHSIESLSPLQAVGIPIALVGAVFLSLGAQFQHRGVVKVEARSGQATKGLSIAQLLALLGRPSWVTGTLMIGLAIVLQLTSLSFAPLTVVQPLGAIALVITAVLNSRVSRTHLNRLAIRAIVLCIGGIALFVTIAAFVSKDVRITDDDLRVILLLLAGVLVVAAGLFLRFRTRMTPIAYIIGAGVMYGFVATLAKTVINSVLQQEFSGLAILSIVGLLTAGAVGAYFVQTAYSVGPPDLVIAGLTVVDPLVAVGIGIVVLRETEDAPLWASALFVLAGAIAVFGVFSLAKHHPQLSETSDDVAAQPTR